MSSSKPLYLTEFFTSIQGETTYSGLPTNFIRCSGCNLRCSWCDTTYSFKRGAPYSLDQVIQFVAESKYPHVCITGGEPLLQTPIFELMKRLCDLGHILSLETSGSISTQAVDHRVKVILDIKCPDSKMNHKNLLSNLGYLKPEDEVKFVIASRSDYQWACEFISTHLLEKKVHLLFSAAWGQVAEKELAAWILEDKLKVRLNLQLHKYIWEPSKRGV